MSTAIYFSSRENIVSYLDRRSGVLGVETEIIEAVADVFADKGYMSLENAKSLLSKTINQFAEKRQPRRDYFRIYFHLENVLEECAETSLFQKCW